jgi:tagatose 6-phosphate kinase
MILAINMNPAIDKVYAVDDFQVGKVFRPRAMTATAGGKGLNVARVAHLLGEKVMVTGLVGGSTGRQIEESVKEQGMDSRFITIQGESRICINVTDEKNITSTEILEPGPVVTLEEGERFLGRYQELLQECSVVTASGSLPKGMPRDLYATLIRMAGESGKNSYWIPVESIFWEV